MATTNDNININVNVNSDLQSVRGLKEEIRKVNIELEAAAKAGDKSKYSELTKRLGELKNDYKDLQQQLLAADPGELLNSMVKMATGAVGAFGAVTAAMDLFGVKSEFINDIQKKSTAIIQLMIGLEQARSLLEAKGTAQGLANQTKRIAGLLVEKLTITTVEGATNGVTKAQLLWNAAVKANPVGLLITGVAALAAGIGFLTYQLFKDTEQQKANKKVKEDLKEANKKAIETYTEQATTLIALKNTYNDNTKSEKERWDAIQKSADAMGLSIDRTKGLDEATKQLNISTDAHLKLLLLQAEYTAIVDQYKKEYQKSLEITTDATKSETTAIQMLINAITSFGDVEETISKSLDDWQANREKALNQTHLVMTSLMDSLQKKSTEVSKAQQDADKADGDSKTDLNKNLQALALAQTNFIENEFQRRREIASINHKQEQLDAKGNAELLKIADLKYSYEKIQIKKDEIKKIRELNNQLYNIQIESNRAINDAAEKLNLLSDERIYKNKIETNYNLLQELKKQYKEIYEPLIEEQRVKQADNLAKQSKLITDNLILTYNFNKDQRDKENLAIDRQLQEQVDMAVSYKWKEIAIIRQLEQQKIEELQKLNDSPLNPDSPEGEKKRKDEIEAINDKYRKKIIKASYDIIKQANDEMVQLQVDFANTINERYDAQETQLMDKYNKMLELHSSQIIVNKNLVSEMSEDELEIYQHLSDDEITILKAFNKERKRLEYESYQERLGYLYQFASTFENTLSQLKAFQLDTMQSEADKRMSILEDTYNREIMMAGNSATQKSKIEAKYQFDKANMEKQAAKESKEVTKKYARWEAGLQATKLVVDTASAIMGFLARPGGFVGAAMSVAAGISGAIQLGIITSNISKLDKMAKGGLIQGQSHLNGGVVKELEGGEAVINARSMSNPQLRAIASDINVAGGGVPFSNITTNLSNKDLVKEIIDGIVSIPVVVVESDITKSQRRVSLAESRGKI